MSVKAPGGTLAWAQPPSGRSPVANLETLETLSLARAGLGLASFSLLSPPPGFVSTMDLIKSLSERFKA